MLTLEPTQSLIRLDGPLAAPDAEDLLERCADLVVRHDVLVVDVSAVTSCDAAGLAALRALARGRAGCEVTVVGARWSQFLELLVTAPLRTVDTRGEEIRGLLRGRATAPVTA